MATTNYLRALALLTAVAAASLVAMSMGHSTASAQSTTGNTFTVNSTGDAPDADNSPDGTCDSDSTAAIVCTLREAIFEANNNGNPDHQDSIEFNIPNNGPHTISPTGTGLPTIRQPLSIDGYTQGDDTTSTTDDAKENTLQAPGGIDAVPKIELSGSNITTNQVDGLTIGAPNVVVKGLVINRFTTTGGQGIQVNFGAEGARLEGNFIGTDPSGTLDRGNSTIGVSTHSNNTQIGGTTPDKRNLISGNNLSGVVLQSSGNTVQGNLIGTSKDGTSELPNNFDGMGISNASNNVIGGDSAAAENVIAHNNCGRGVVINGTGSSGNSILRNSIFDNGCTLDDLGIDLVASTDTSTDAVTDNDRKDTDLGPNNLQNFPQITSATLSGSQITIEGTLDSRPRKSFTIRFFSSHFSEADQTGFGEGKTFIGQKTVKTNRKGKRSFSFTFTPEQAVTTGQKITATATNDKTGDTSEFSNAVSASSP